MCCSTWYSTTSALEAEVKLAGTTGCCFGSACSVDLSIYFLEEKAELDKMSSRLALS
jgi:hypothetical protein